MRHDPGEALSRLGFSAAEVTVEHLAHNRWLTPGIWRISASGRRMVLKILSPDRPVPETPWDAHWTSGVRDQRMWNYWAREGLAYRHRVVEVYEAGGIVAPAIVAADYGDDAIVLLLEFVDGRPGEQWAIADYAAASRALGRAQGRLVAGAPVADHPWLTRGFLREYSRAKPVDWSCSTPTTRGHTPVFETTSRPNCAPRRSGCTPHAIACTGSPKRYQESCATSTSGP